MSSPETERDFQDLRLERRGTALWIRLHRPEARNALTPDMVRELGEALDFALADDCRALVLTGDGPAFCAGADLKASKGLFSAPGRNPFANLLLRLQDFPKPVIAAVNGAAFGGGLGLLSVADIAFGAAGATFSFSEVRLGLIPAMISVFVLPKIGPHQARRLFLTGRRFSATDAVSYGLLHEVAPDEELTAAVDREVAQLTKGGPEAQTAVKALIRDVPGLGVDAALDLTSQRIAERATSEEGREGLSAFATKRPPSWTVDPSTESDR